jgi:DNA/RNA-binding domain of Phe-tRNA-synthetase-like protein
MYAFIVNFGAVNPISMKPITIEAEIYAAAPSYAGCVVECSVLNSAHAPLLWEEIAAETHRLRSVYVVEEVNKLPGIYEMRQLYKKLGKDPNRYRPSAEALCRRLLLGKELYRINTLVDLINLVSIRTGFSIGGFDAEKVQGELSIGVGQAGESFEAIGRGQLNIEGLPVYRDALGAIGTPTSDVERSKLSLETSRLLMVVHSAGGASGLDEAVELALRLLTQYAQAHDFSLQRF